VLHSQRVAARWKPERNNSRGSDASLDYFLKERRKDMSKRRTRNLPLVLLLVTTISGAVGPTKADDNSELFDVLKEKDRLLFKLGYDECDEAQLNLLTSDDFEFYHDKGGVTNSKTDFIESMKELCTLAYKPTRELVQGTLRIFPLYDNDTLYGAVQTGEHEFYALEEGKPRYLTSTAKFTTVWVLEQGEWKMRRVLSYDHQTPE
jgi:hypothetical protein